jgi:ABC-2 type transport system ATP-binding protein
MAAIEVASLTVRYGDVVAVDDLSFTADAGRVTCVLGPNGAGKTSTIECLEGLRRPTSGRLSVIGLDPRADHRQLVERIGVMLQDGGVQPAIRPLEALRHAAAFYAESHRPADLLDRLGLSGLERRTWRQLSGGEQRRLALALALVGRPQVAFLDEPTAGVDPAGRQTIREVIGGLRAEGVTVLLTTHDLDEAERVADDVVIVDRGRLVARGTLAELLGGPGTGDRVRFSAPPDLDTASLGAYLGATVTETRPGDYEVAAAPAPATVAAITGWLAEHDLPLADLHAGRQRLEDVFLQLTGNAGEPEAGTEGTGPRRAAESGPAATPDRPASAEHSGTGRTTREDGGAAHREATNGPAAPGSEAAGGMADDRDTTGETAHGATGGTDDDHGTTTGGTDDAHGTTTGGTDDAHGPTTGGTDDAHGPSGGTADDRGPAGGTADDRGAAESGEDR